MIEPKHHTIIEITSFLPGRPIPQDYLQEVERSDGEWFFIPSGWNEENGWGNPVSRRRKYPLVYSEGYKTEEEAIRAAVAWEAEEETKQLYNELNDKWWNNMVHRLS